ncbi:MAG: tetratricopeptide repeat protein [Phycisphaerae bacterium]
MKYRLATQQIEAGRIDEAVMTLQQAIELHPDNAALQRLMALCKTEQGDMPAATAAADRAAALGDESADLAYIKGLIAEQQRRHEQALLHYNQAAARDPQNVDYFLAVVESLVTLDRPAQARQFLDDRIDDFGRDARLLLLRAGVCALVGDLQQVADDYDELIVVMHDSPWVAQQYGLVLLQLNRYEEALAVLLPLLGTAPFARWDEIPISFLPAPVGRAPPADSPSPAVVRAVATCYLRMDQPHQVPPLVNSHLRRNPNDARAWWLLAEASARLSDWPVVRRCLRSGRRLNPDRPEWKLLHAYLSFRQGDTTTAAEILESALSQHPDHKPALSFLGEIRDGQGIPTTDTNDETDRNGSQ